MKRFFLFFAFLSLITPSFIRAQTETPQQQRVEAIKIAFITDKLELTSKEATVFWPVFNEFTAQQKKIKEKFRDLALEMRGKKELSESEAEQFIQQQLSLRQSEIDLVKKYVTEFKKVLPSYKVARLMTLEDDFKQQLMKRMQEKRTEGQRFRND